MIVNKIIYLFKSKKEKLKYDNNIINTFLNEYNTNKFGALQKLIINIYLSEDNKILLLEKLLEQNHNLNISDIANSYDMIIEKLNKKQINFLNDIFLIFKDGYITNINLFNIHMKIIKKKYSSESVDLIFKNNFVNYSQNDLFINEFVNKRIKIQDKSDLTSDVLSFLKNNDEIEVEVPIKIIDNINILKEFKNIKVLVNSPNEFMPFINEFDFNCIVFHQLKFDNFFNKIIISNEVGYNNFLLLYNAYHKEISDKFIVKYDLQLLIEHDLKIFLEYNLNNEMIKEISNYFNINNSTKISIFKDMTNESNILSFIETKSEKINNELFDNIHFFNLINNNKIKDTHIIKQFAKKIVRK